MIDAGLFRVGKVLPAALMDAFGGHFAGNLCQGGSY